MCMGIDYFHAFHAEDGLHECQDVLGDPHSNRKQSALV